MFRKFRSFIVGLVVGLSLISAAALAVDYGWSPVTGLEAFHGAFVSQGVKPVVTGTCGTFGAQTGGATAGTVATGATTCTIILTFPSAAPNGWLCRFNDLTTPADLIVQASSTTTSCTSNAATVVSADVIQYLAVGY